MRMQEWGERTQRSREPRLWQGILLVPLHYGVLVPLHYGVLVPLHYGVLVPLHYGVLAHPLEGAG